MSHRRYSLGLALQLTRGALTATNRASRKYAHGEAAKRVQWARDSLLLAERDLCRAIRDVLDARAREKAKRAA